MSKKGRLAVAYCVICTVLFIAVFTLISYTGKLPQAWTTALFTVLYCVITVTGAFLIVKLGSSSSPSDLPPRSARSVTHLLAVMKTPAAVTDGDGKIVWYNNAFSDITEDGLSKDTDLQKLCGLTLKDLLKDDSGEGAAAKVGDSFYRVFGYPQSGSNGRTVTTLWFDVSKEEAYKTKLDNERLIVAYVIIDMADNFLSGMQDQYADAAADVTKLLRGWADSCKGHIREYDAGKYIMMFYADQLSVMKRDAFPVLNEVKKITFGDDAVPMTLSIGIADCGGNVADKCALASSAMSFALQRGGDQVVIKNDRGAKDEFYGGLSKHDPQLTGLNARRLVLQATPLIKKAGSVLIMGHKNADFDCLASCMGIAKICLSLGKKTTIVVKDNKNIARSYARLKEMPDYKDIFYDFDRDDFDMIEHDSLLFIMDVNNPAIFEYPEMTNHVSSIIIIDHHRMFSSSFPFETRIQYIEPSASSASEIVAQMLEQFFPSGVLTADEASSFFALNKKAFMFELKLESSMRMYKGGFAICAGDDNTPAPDPASSARVAETVLKIEGVSASFAVCRMNTDVNGDPAFSISARSDGKENVQIILERLGGGGHHSNAGAQLSTGKTVQVYDGPLPKLTSDFVVKLLEKAIDSGVKPAKE